MFEYLTGRIIELTPAHLVLENGGTGYFINISLNTYTRLSGEKDAKIYIHQVVREDAHVFFGFADAGERELFRLLITVSGIGANTARMMLSSLSASEIEKAILEGNADTLKSVKGIGLRSAQRIIVDLKNKMGKTAEEKMFSPAGAAVREEALSALVALGFQKAAVEKVIGRLLSENDGHSVETLVKNALRRL